MEKRPLGSIGLSRLGCLLFGPDGYRASLIAKKKITIKRFEFASESASDHVLFLTFTSDTDENKFQPRLVFRRFENASGEYTCCPSYRAWLATIEELRVILRNVQKYSADDSYFVIKHEQHREERWFCN